jgi:hypothetical protein
MWQRVGRKDCSQFDASTIHSPVCVLYYALQRIKVHFCTSFIFHAGLAAPLVAQKLLGATGEYAMLFLILMAVMSTGSAEVIAVASIIIYDVYQAYVQPFRPNLKEDECIICGKPVKARDGLETCVCPSASRCDPCKVSD